MAAETTGRILAGHNLELKAKVDDLEVVRDRVRALRARRQGEERQVDRYYVVPRGRLKLRESTFDGAHLIAYLRPEDARVCDARFHRLPVEDPDGLAETLATMLEEGPRVEKRREVWWRDDVRIHLDRVEGLGAFVELEARVDAIGDRDEAADRLETVADALGIEPDGVVNGSYGEMKWTSRT